MLHEPVGGGIEIVVGDPTDYPGPWRRDLEFTTGYILYSLPGNYDRWRLCAGVYINGFFRPTIASALSLVRVVA